MRRKFSFLVGGGGDLNNIYTHNILLNHCIFFIFSNIKRRGDVPPPLVPPWHRIFNFTENIAVSLQFLIMTRRFKNHPYYLLKKGAHGSLFQLLLILQKTYQFHQFFKVSPLQELCGLGLYQERYLVKYCKNQCVNGTVSRTRPQNTRTRADVTKQPDTSSEHQ